MEEFDKEDEKRHKITQDEKYLLASGLYKFCRLGNATEAVKYAEKLFRGTSAYYVFRILSQLCGEDLSPDEYLKIMPTIRALYESSKKGDIRGHDAWMATFCIAKARKWYQTPDGEELELVRHQVNKKNKEIKTLEPDFLFDQHVREGIRRVKEGSPNLDLRLSGKWQHRFQLLERWQRLVFDFPNWTFEEQRERWIQIHMKPRGVKNERQETIEGRPEKAVDGTEQPDKSKEN